MAGYTIRNVDTGEVVECDDMNKPPEGWLRWETIGWPPMPMTYVDSPDYSRVIFTEEPDGTLTLAEGATWEEAARLAMKCYRHAMNRQSEMTQEFLDGLRSVGEKLNVRS